jgi:serine/threonine-protein kinase
MEKSLGSAYVLHHALGRGAMGQVFAGSVRQTGEPVAVKLLRPELVSDPDVVARFIRERTILTSIHDPHVVRVMDLVVEGETLAIVMELVQGPDLRRYLRDRRTLAPAEAVDLVGQLLLGAAAGHAAGIVHRDIKPENMLLEAAASPPVVKLTDFGVARLTYGTSLTKLSSLIGTPEYMAPELAEHDRATPAADVYSSGIVLYEMLCGRTPFAGGHPLAVLRRHIDQAPAAIPGLPPALWDAISSMLAKDPRSRPASAAEAAALLMPLRPSLAAMAALPPWGAPEEPLTRSAPGTHDMSGRAADETVLRYRDRGDSPHPDERASRPGGLLTGPEQPAGSVPPSRRKRSGRRMAVLAVGVAVVIAAATTVALAATRSPAPTRPTAIRQVAAAVTVKPSAKPRPTKSRSVPTPVPATGQVVIPATQVPPERSHPASVASSALAPPPSPAGSSTAMTSPPPTSPTPTPTPTVTYDAAEQTLVNSLVSNVFDNCMGRPDLETGIVVAALNCSSLSSGPSLIPLIEVIASGDEQTWFADNTSGFTNTDSTCTVGTYVGTWQHNGTTQGLMACGLQSNGDLEIVWVVNDDVGFIAEGPDSDMYSWWQGIACQALNSC